MSNMAVCHMEKGSGSTGGMQGHNERSYDVKNADPERADLNFFVSHNSELSKLHITKQNPRQGTYKSREDAIIEKRTIKRKIQHNAVKRLSFALSGSHEQMKKLEKEGKIKEWAAENYKFMGKKYGFENITEFAVHMDERTPHIHCMVVPMVTTEKGTKLCARDLTSKDQLVELQDQYAESMKKFGLERGLKGSRAKHEDVKEFYARVDKSKELQQTFSTIPNIDIKTNLLEGKEKYAKRVLDEANKVLSQKMEFEKEKNKSILAKFMESNRKTFLQELHKSKFKLDKSDLQKLEKIKTLDQELAIKSIAKKDVEFLKNLKKAYKEKDLESLNKLMKNWGQSDKNLENKNDKTLKR